MSGHLVILTGIPGSGKTRLANHLATHHDYFILSRDLIKRTTFGDLDTGIPQNHIAFTAMQSALPILLASNKKVILDGMPFNRVGQAEIMESVALDYGTPYIIMHLDLPPEVAANRLSTPDPSAPADRKPNLPFIVHKSFRRIPEHWIPINANQEPEAVITAVLPFILKEPES